MTNPALGSALLWAFLEAAEDGGRGVEFSILFLPLPILLSSSLTTRFEGTNSRTGFYAWLDRNPELSVGMGERVARTAPLPRRALLYGAQIDAITADGEGRFRATRAVREAALRRAGEAVRPLFPLAKRFGGWVGAVGSSRDVLYAFGLTV
jgi:hypothetical protein